jgi:DNA mismatch endonuclease, patch repair protein
MKKRIISLACTTIIDVVSAEGTARQSFARTAWGIIREAGTARTAMDTLTRLERSKRMALIRSKDTKPELLVRKIARSSGYKFRLHVSDLPGKPDLVFPRRRKVIFIHGCFWHRHPSTNCPLARLPKSKLDFWLPKLSKNRRRDLRNIAQLRRNKWEVCVVWECQLSNLNALKKRLAKFLERNYAKR